MSETQDAIKELTEKVNSGYTNLSKWLIGLSAGAIVFSVRLVKPGMPEYLTLVLIDGLGCLIVSIISGILYVRASLDNLHYNLLSLRVEKEINTLVAKNELEKETGSRKDRIDYLKGINKKAKRRFRILNKFLFIIMPIHLWLFLFGIVLIAAFGILAIQSR